MNNNGDSDYEKFLASKRIKDVPTGKNCELSDIHPMLFDFQRLIVRWAVRRGRAAIFADCGLGKTFCQLEWARLVGGRCLIFAPLAVAQQTVTEAKKIGLKVDYARRQAESVGQMTVTNYERIENFDPSQFNCVVCDESAILKSIDGKIRTFLIEMFANTPYRLCCTATPAPNDHAELANHCEFLGVMTRAEMLATFFVHDDDWRLKGHAADDFWRWLVSWAVCLRSPSDIGCDASRFILPPLTWHRHVVQTAYRQEGMLIGSELGGIQGRHAARRATINERVSVAADLVNQSTEQWVLWCNLNPEGDALEKEIPDAVQISGKDSMDEKQSAIVDFIAGKIRVLVSKPEIFGHGLNLQNCHNVLYVGLGDSFEALYQSVRRFWRFGQEKEVHAYVVTADAEGPVVENIKRKESEFEQMHRNMVEHMKELETKELHGMERDRAEYKRAVVNKEEWTIHMGDCCEVSKELATDSIDFSICSPPFSSLFTYNASERDLGNCKSEDEFLGHYEFLCREWVRITKPGRLAAVHVAQIPAMLSRDGYIGLKDFRGSVIRAHQRCGWIFHGEIAVQKNPQSQSIRTKAKGLGFRQLESDASWMRPALADFVLLFRKPGENQVSVKPEVTRDQWIDYAAPCWIGIRETDTLTVAEAREEKDERHIAPLQLGLIDRCVRLWSNRGETVFTPFCGIGSEIYQSLLLYRKGIGIELKEAYFKVACHNAKRAIEKRSEGLLPFDEKAMSIQAV